MAASNSSAATRSERQVSEIYAKYFQGTLKPQFVIMRKGENEGNEWLKKLARNPFKKLPKSSPIPKGLVPLSAHEVAFVAELATVRDHNSLDHDMPDAPSGPGMDEVDLDVIMAEAPPLDEAHELDSTELLIIVDADIEMKEAPPLDEAHELDSTELLVIGDSDIEMEEAPPLSSA